MTITNRVSLKSVMAGNTPVPDVVDAPTIGTATAGVESATVTFTAAATGGEATSFGAISTPGSITGTSATSPITVSGLTGGTAYTFKTYGINSSGTWSNVLSAASNSVTPTVATSYESIASVTVGSGGSASVSFSSIPATYTHLQIRGFVADNATNCNFYMSFNGNTATNGHAIYGEGGNVVSYDNSSPGLIYGQRTNTGQFVFITDLLDYTNANKNKTIRTLAGGDANGAGRVGLYSGFINNTAAITSLSIAPNTSNFPQYSVVSLYGIKGA